MAHIITAVYEKGVLRPLSPVPLAEQQIVQLHIVPIDEAGCVIPGIGCHRVAHTPTRGNDGCTCCGSNARRWLTVWGRPRHNPCQK